jgi:DNA-binding transcriptional ArsR family regulator
MPKVVLEQKALEALASETRVGVLKQLGERQRTLTQIARALAMDKAAVYRHLQKLGEGRLVEKDASHAFTYYRLTWQGRAVVRPQDTTRIAIVLGSSLAAGIGAMLALVAYLTPRYELDPILDAPRLVPPEPMFLAAAIVLLSIVALLIAGAVRTVRPRRAGMTATEEAEEKTPFFRMIGREGVSDCQTPR